MGASRRVSFILLRTCVGAAQPLETGRSGAERIPALLLARLNKPLRRRWFALLTLCAFALHAAVPRGFMIGVNGGHAPLELRPALTPAHPMRTAPRARLTPPRRRPPRAGAASCRAAHGPR